jgi:hypothetical protein
MRLQQINRKRKAGGSLKAFENLEKKWNDKGEEGSEKGGGMDMLNSSKKKKKRPAQATLGHKAIILNVAFYI